MVDQHLMRYDVNTQCQPKYWAKWCIYQILLNYNKSYRPDNPIGYGQTGGQMDDIQANNKGESIIQ